MKHTKVVTSEIASVDLYQHASLQDEPTEVVHSFIEAAEIAGRRDRQEVIFRLKNGIILIFHDTELTDGQNDVTIIMPGEVL